MADNVLPTTRAQVAGHRFLVRRMHHGLVFGDTRMIHDPLGRRQRGLIFGVAAGVLLAAGAGLLAVMDPQADASEAPLLRDESGALYVNIDGVSHPVENLASARLILGEAVSPRSIGAEALAELHQGPPVGIPGAPGVIAEDPDDEGGTFSACTGEELVVHLGDAQQPLPEEKAVLIQDGTTDWLVTASGRTRLPAAATVPGRVVRRALGINGETPTWSPPREFTAAIRELPPVTAPDPLPLLLEVDGGHGGSWAEFPEGVVKLSSVQAEILQGLGATRLAGEHDHISARPDHPLPPGLSLPEEAPEFLASGESEVCVSGPDGTPTLPPAGQTGGVELPDGAASRYVAPPTPGAVAVDTGAGIQVLTPYGVRHTVTDQESLSALGVTADTTRVAGYWPVVRMLPEGPELSREAALNVVTAAERGA